MRPATFLCSAFLFSAVLLAQSYLPTNLPIVQQSAAQMSQHRPNIWGSDGERMVTRAKIVVVPLDVVTERKMQLESLRSRVGQAELDSLRLGSQNPIVRGQLTRQVETMRALLNYIDRGESDLGKSAAATEVQRHLNEIEGRVNCEACHTRVVAKERRR